ncbi:MAG TPA: GWxTD domain-containing protein [Bacteroidota bacterium]|nr:GWxTD domain-containing protein [Bacteroidota bacterium]
MKRMIGLAVLLALGISAGTAQRTAQKQSFVLNLDYAKFRNNDSSGYVEIYYGFYPSLITYGVRDGRRTGVLKVQTQIIDQKTGAYLVNVLSTVLVPQPDSIQMSSRTVSISQAGHALPFGEYKLNVFVSDSLSPAKRDSIGLPVTLTSYGTAPAISDIELCSSLRNSTQTTDLYYKNSLEVIPNPTLVFGATSHPMMFHYAEIYNIDTAQTYVLKTQVLAPDGKIAKETSKARHFGVKSAVEAGMTNVASLASGKYRIQLVLVDEKGVMSTQTAKSFYVYNPHIQAALPAASSIKASELAGMTAAELADEFSKAQYLATDQEIKTFSQITSEEGRREFLAKFWSEVETGRLGRAGILRSVYLQRVLSADQRFHALGRPGWRTDRGRVLALYAEPDEIERFPSSQDTKPYETWHYYSIENGVDFIFVDRSGFGDYTLVNSTKRGELQDDDWQRFLK